MFGILIATVYTGYLIATHGSDPESWYPTATEFLFEWYLATFLGTLLFLLVFYIYSIATSSDLDKVNSGLFGDIARFFIGRDVSLMVALHVLLRRAFFTVGAYLMHEAFKYGNIVDTWDDNYLALGAVLILGNLLVASPRNNEAYK